MDTWPGPATVCFVLGLAQVFTFAVTRSGLVVTVQFHSRNEMVTWCDAFGVSEVVDVGDVVSLVTVVPG